MISVAGARTAATPTVGAPELGERGSSSARRRWALALLFSLSLAALYGIPDLKTAFGGPYVVTNNARQHAFWTRRYQDPGLFPQDPIADYFQDVAPAGYALLYRAAAAAGLDPLVFGKILPLFLVLVSAGYAFGLTARILPSPWAASLAAIFLSQQLWATDEVPAASPHAFAVPLLASFLYYAARRARGACLVSVALQGLLYPHVLLVSCGILGLGLVRWDAGRLRLSRHRSDGVFLATVLVTAAASALPFVLSARPYGPSVTAGEARAMPEFLRGGTAAYFGPQWESLLTWVNDMRGGLLGRFFRGSGPTVLSARPMLWGGLLFPVVLALRRALPSARRVGPDAGLLLRAVLASILLFAAAHVLLFRLHLPGRYTSFTSRVVLAVAGAATWTILAESLFRRLPRRGLLGSPLAAATAAGAAAFLLAPFARGPAGSYVVGGAPALYRFLESQPEDALVASISPEADNLPVFARRSVLVAGLFAVPYQLGYYRPFRARVLDLLRAEYAEDPRVLARFIRAYRVDFILLDRWSFRPRSLTLDSWVKQYRPLVGELARELGRGSRPALERMAARCTVLETERLILVDARCLLEGG